MRWRNSAFLLGTAFSTTVLAAVKFTLPAAGAAIPAGAIQIEWIESGDSPTIDKLVSYQLFLCAGGNDEGSILQLFPIVTRGQFNLGNKASGVITPNLGASKPLNAYFLKIISVIDGGGTITNYSPRFTMSAMTGSFPPNVLNGIAAVTDLNGPTRQLITEAQNLGGNGLYGLPYSMQTGPVIYAPMQSYPPTKITKSKATPLFPPSPVSIATTYLKPNTLVQKTATESKTWSFSQRENPASALKGPAGDMHKFLNRWKD